MIRKPKNKLKPKPKPQPKTNTKALDKTQDEALVQTFLDMIAPNIVKFEPDYFICGNTFRCCWALRDYPTSTTEQAILQHLGEKAGVTLHIYTRVVTPAEERKIINLADKKNRMERGTNDMRAAVTADENLQDIPQL